MPHIPTLFQDLPTASRVWVYQSNRPFTDSEAQAIESSIETFVGEWTAHKLKVAAGATLLYNRFVILAADEREVGVSGCSIDGSVRFIKELGAKYGVDFFDRFHVAYKDGNEVRSTNRAGFEELIASGKINAETVVYNNLVENLDGLRSQWEVPFKDSWHSMMFQLV
ncbi:hypothetical protein BH09BAC1_BH09BAC1_11910 [soil metagenome]